MQVGDLVEITKRTEMGIESLGVVTDIYQDPEGEFDSLLVVVLWCSGHQTHEYFVNLEVVPCK